MREIDPREAERLVVSGVGTVKAARYGGAFLDAIRSWRTEQEKEENG